MNHHAVMNHTVVRLTESNRLGPTNRARNHVMIVVCWRAALEAREHHGVKSLAFRSSAAINDARSVGFFGLGSANSR